MESQDLQRTRMSLHVTLTSPVAVESITAETAAEVQLTAILLQVDIQIAGVEFRQRGIFPQTICSLSSLNLCALDGACTAIRHKITIQTGR